MAKAQNTMPGTIRAGDGARSIYRTLRRPIPDGMVLTIKVKQGTERSPPFFEAVYGCGSENLEMLVRDIRAGFSSVGT